MSITPRIIGSLADLTAIRDRELLEFSLLKTLHGFLMPEGISLLKLDMKHNPRMEIVYGQSKCTVHADDIIVPMKIRIALDHLINSETQQFSIKSGESIITMYVLHRTRTTRTFLLLTTGGELTKLNAYLVGGMLQVYRNFCDLLTDAQTDLLTGLANRKTFDECVMKVYELIPPEKEHFPDDRRGEGPLSYWLAMVDIDHFKAVNDRFGHLYGDEILVLLAQILKSIFREDDMIFRFGGEEFVIIVRCPDLQTCRTALERLRTTVETYNFPQIGTITVSIGAARMSRNIFAMTLVDYADQALYYSKQNGRNQITFFEEMVDCGLAFEEDIEPGSIELF